MFIYKLIWWTQTLPLYCFFIEKALPPFKVFLTRKRFSRFFNLICKELFSFNNRKWCISKFSFSIFQSWPSPFCFWTPCFQSFSSTFIWFSCNSFESVTFSSPEIRFCVPLSTENWSFRINDGGMLKCLPFIYLTHCSRPLFLQFQIFSSQILVFLKQIGTFWIVWRRC